MKFSSVPPLKMGKTISIPHKKYYDWRYKIFLDPFKIQYIVVFRLFPEYVLMLEAFSNILWRNCTNHQEYIVWCRPWRSSPSSSASCELKAIAISQDFVSVYVFINIRKTPFLQIATIVVRYFPSIWISMQN